MRARFLAVTLVLAWMVKAHFFLIVCCASIGLVALGGAITASLRHESSPKSSPESAANLGTKSKPELAVRRADSNADAESLKQRLRSLVKARMALPQPSAVPSRAPAGSSYRELVEALTSAEQEEFGPILERERVLLRSELCEAKLASETHDDAWAIETERAVAVAYEHLDQSLFPTTKLGHITCGSTICRVEVSQRDPVEQGRFVGALRTDLRTFGRQNDETRGEPRGWTLYMARKGHELPKVP